MSLSANLSEYIGSRASGVLNLLQGVRWALPEDDAAKCEAGQDGAMSMTSAGVVELCHAGAIKPVGATELFAGYGRCANATAPRSWRSAASLNLELGAGTWQCLVTGSITVSSLLEGVEVRALAGGCTGDTVVLAEAFQPSLSTGTEPNHRHPIGGTTQPGGAQAKTSNEEAPHKHVWEGQNTVGSKNTALAGENRTGTNAIQVSDGKTEVTGNQSTNPPENRYNDHTHFPGSLKSNLDWEHRHSMGEIGTSAGTSHNHNINEFDSGSAGGHNHTVSLGKLRQRDSFTMQLMCADLEDGDAISVQFQSVSASGESECHAASVAAVCKRV